MCYFNLDFDMCYYYIENLNTNTISNKLYIAYHINKFRYDSWPVSKPLGPVRFDTDSMIRSFVW